MQTFSVILEYCGGERTDRLYEQLSGWNPQQRIHVLDNASPSNRCRYITNQNVENSFIGNGISDCLRLAEEHRCQFLCLIMNDIRFVTRFDISSFERLMTQDQNIIQISSSLNNSSSQIRPYPWMAHQEPPSIRRVIHADIVCSMVRCSFVKSFGGFPASKGGWGYDYELAYHANLQHKNILICDDVVSEHEGNRELSQFALGTGFDKRAEMRSIYRSRYGDFETTMSKFFQQKIAENNTTIPYYHKDQSE